MFWIHASNAQRFRQAFGEIAQQCHVPGCDSPQADVLLLVKKWLERAEQGQWLMVIDNADDTQLFFPSQPDKGSIHGDRVAESESGLGRYIPECSHGSILITTRNKQTGLRLTRGRSLVEVREMTASEANSFLHTTLENEHISVEDLKLDTRLPKRTDISRFDIGSRVVAGSGKSMSFLHC
jgi:hypothetical protein